MAQSPVSPHLATPPELKERLAAERTGAPFVVYRDEQGRQQLILLPEDGELTIGREPDSNIPLAWDAHVSGLHAELRRTGGRWLVVDDGLSRNGTYVNDQRVLGRRQLRDGDQVRVGTTILVFRQPRVRQVKSTAVESETTLRAHVSPAQRRVLVALCRPYADGAEFAQPATNQEIAEELYLSVAAVKAHLRAMFPRFGLDGLPHNDKRVQLAKRALQTGIVSPAEISE